jgi:hypothetical protein
MIHKEFIKTSGMKNRIIIENDITNGQKKIVSRTDIKPGQFVGDLHNKKFQDTLLGKNITIDNDNPNSTYTVNRGRYILRTTKPIREGQEIVVKVKKEG